MALGVTVDFTANIAKFSSQVDKISGDLNRFQQRAESVSSKISSAFGALGVGLSVAGLASFVKSGIDAADMLNDMSLKTGIAVENLAGFQLATKQSGTDMEAFTSAANKLSVNIAKNGEAFKKLGIDAKDPADAFIQLADVFASIEDPQQRAAFAAKALGKSWQDMAPLLSQGGAGLRAAVEEGKKLSGVTTEMAQEADKFNDEIARMQSVLSSAAAIAGGAFAEGFNQLINKISEATQSGVTFNNVMTGIGNFAFQNVFDDVERIGTVSTKVNEINERIVKARDELKKSEAHTTGMSKLLSAFGNRDAEIKAEKDLNGLLLERDQLLIHESESRRKIKAEASAPAAKTVADFIGGGGEKAASHAAASHARAKTAVDQLQKSYESMLASLTKEIALRDANSEAAKLEYEIINGSLKGLTPMQQNKLMMLAKEKDALETQDKMWAALVESANEYYDLRKSNDELIRSGGIQEGFNQALANVDEQLQNFNITTEQAKAEYVKLGKAFNDEFISPAIAATDKMSEFSIQAARNMETAFANFLFDPFNSNMGGMLDGFITTLRKMAAEATASMIFDAFKKNGTQWLDTAVSGLSSIFGAVGSAKGNVFQGGNVMAFAGGGVVNRPTYFPMSGGKTGLMGEAGPEAIVPLARDASGKLGIKGSGGAVNITVNVQSGPAPDVRRAAGQGAREALNLLGGAGRYG